MSIHICMSASSTELTITIPIPDSGVINKATPEFDEESGTFICGYAIRGIRCKDTPIAPQWKCRRHGGAWQPTVRFLGTAGNKGAELGLYDGNTWKGYGIIKKQIESYPEKVERLFSTNLEDELAMARILLMEITKGAKIDNPRLAMRGLKLIAEVAKIAREIQKLEENALKREFITAVMEAISHAFTTANAHQRPSDRARVFMSEITSMLPGNVNISVPTTDVYEAEVSSQ